MLAIGFILSIPIAIAVFILVLNDRLRAKRAHAAFTRVDVIAAIQDVMSPDYDEHGKWESFLALPIRDAYLEAVRRRCIAISNEHSDKEDGKVIASAGEAELHLILDELVSASLNHQ